MSDKGSSMLTVDEEGALWTKMGVPCLFTKSGFDARFQYPKNKT